MIDESGPPTPGARDAIKASITLGGSPDPTVVGTFVETRVDSEHYQLFLPGISEPDGQLRIVDVTQGAETDGGLFQPFTVRISGDTEVLRPLLDGTVASIGENAYTIREQPDGSFALTGSEVRILILHELRPGRPPNWDVVKMWIVPFQENKLIIPGLNFRQYGANMKVTDVLHGDENVWLNVTVVRKGLTFRFNAGTDSFRIIPKAGQPLAPIQGSIQASSNQDETVLSGFVRNVKLPIGSHDVEITAGGKTSVIAGAIEVKRPVRLIIANFYGDPPRSRAQGMDDHIFNSARAMTTTTYKGDPALVHVIRVSTATALGPGLKPRAGDIDTIADIADFALRKRNVRGGLGLRPNSVISVDTLGHGTAASVGVLSGLRIVARDPDNAGVTKEVRVSSVGNVRDGKLADATYAGYFERLLAKTRMVDFKLWHCYQGGRLTNQLSQVHRLAGALADMEVRNQVVGFTDIVNFPAAIDDLPGGVTRLTFGPPFGRPNPPVVETWGAD